jgi:hypothetical protein
LIRSDSRPAVIYLSNYCYETKTSPAIRLLEWQSHLNSNSFSKLRNFQTIMTGGCIDEAMAVGFFAAMFMDGKRIRSKHKPGRYGATGADPACARRSTGKAGRRIGIREAEARSGGCRGSAAGTHADGPALGSECRGSQPESRGFSDFTFAATDQKGIPSGFSEGQFILHINSHLSPRSAFLGEVSLTARSDAGTGTPPATGFNAEVERSIIRFEHNDYFKVSFGRYHTPINYWNTTFHHGQWLQTTVSRPEMTQFGGKFIPVHFVGALVEGATPAGGLNFNYNFGVGNGRGNVISRAGDAGDNNNSRAYLVNFFVRPDRFYGLQAGGSGYRDRITTGGIDYNEWITSAHVVWTRETPEIIAEFANVRHENRTFSASIANSQAFYVQAAYRLSILDKKLKPYYRYDYIHVPKSDTAFQPIPIWPDRRWACDTTSRTLRRSSSSTGIRFGLQARQGSTAYLLQTSFAF